MDIHESIKRAIPTETYLDNDIHDISHFYRVPYRSDDRNFRKFSPSGYFWCADYATSYDGNFLLLTFSDGSRSWDNSARTFLELETWESC